MKKTPRPAFAETDLGEAMMQALSRDGWDCYPEVSMGMCSARPDIVAVRAGKVMIVECKTSLSFDLLSQALGWLDDAHFVAICIPKPKIGSRSRDIFVRDYLKSKGIGLFEVALEFDGRGADAKVNFEWTRVRHDIEPKLHRHAHRRAKELMAWLQPDMKTVSPGCQKGYMTDFKRTLRNLEGYVKRHPGCTLKLAIENIEHHYSSVTSARGALGKLIHLADVQVRHLGKTLVLYPKDAELPPVATQPSMIQP